MAIEEIAPHYPDIFISDHIIFDDYLVLEIRENGLPGIQKIKLSDKSSSMVAFNEESYYVSLSYNLDSKDKNFYYVSIGQVGKIINILKKNKLGISWRRNHEDTIKR